MTHPATTWIIQDESTCCLSFQIVDCRKRRDCQQVMSAHILVPRHPIHWTFFRMTRTLSFHNNSVLFTNLVRWHASAVSFPLSDIILGQLARLLSDTMFCLHSGITNLSLYKHWSYWNFFRQCHSVSPEEAWKISWHQFTHQRTPRFLSSTLYTFIIYGCS